MNDNEKDKNCWKLGVFYYNPNNPSIFVSKRSGIGTTINFGSFVGKIIGIALIILIAYLILRKI